MKHETKICPRCTHSFECKVGDVENCQCSISINDATKTFLTQTNFDCLCVECLKHFNQLVIRSKKILFPIQKEFLIEGEHYYTENGAWVFTELYHLQRGYCCKNGCRHCVYGFKNKNQTTQNDE